MPGWEVIVYNYYVAKWVVDWVVPAASKDVIRELICAGKNVLCWAWSLFLGQTVWVLEMLEATGIDSDVLGPLTQFYLFVSYWLPLNELLLLLGGIQSVTLTIITVRFVKKWIPTLSG